MSEAAAKAWIRWRVSASWVFARDALTANGLRPPPTPWPASIADAGASPVGPLMRRITAIFAWLSPRKSVSSSFRATISTKRPLRHSSNCWTIRLVRRAIAQSGSTPYQPVTSLGRMGASSAISMMALVFSEIEAAFQMPMIISQPSRSQSSLVRRWLTSPESTRQAWMAARVSPMRESNSSAD